MAICPKKMPRFRENEAGQVDTSQIAGGDRVITGLSRQRQWNTRGSEKFPQLVT
jgi:hypothetical protein